MAHFDNLWRDYAKAKRGSLEKKDAKKQMYKEPQGPFNYSARGRGRGRGRGTNQNNVYWNKSTHELSPAEIAEKKRNADICKDMEPHLGFVVKCLMKLFDHAMDGFVCNELKFFNKHRLESMFKEMPVLPQSLAMDFLNMVSKVMDYRKYSATNNYIASLFEPRDRGSGDVGTSLPTSATVDTAAQDHSLQFDDSGEEFEIYFDDFELAAADAERQLQQTKDLLTSRSVGLILFPVAKIIINSLANSVIPYVVREKMVWHLFNQHHTYILCAFSIKFNIWLT